MALTVNHSTVVDTPDDGTSEVGSNEWNAAHTVTGAVDAIEPEAVAQVLSSNILVGEESFAVIGDGVANDGAAIQAAIDHGCNEGIGKIKLPPGDFRSTGPLYLDPPDNLRVDLDTPPRFNFSLHLEGSGGPGWEGFKGSNILGDFTLTDSGATRSILWVGSGNGMRVSDLNVFHSDFSEVYIEQEGSAISIAGGNGGASRTLIENCAVGWTKYGYSVGVNSDSLGDSNTWLKCVANKCRYGYYIGATQNYVNHLVSSQAQSCKTGVYSPVGKSVIIDGGNFSCQLPSGDYTMASVSALTEFTENFQGSDFANYRFTATITDSDAELDRGDWDLFGIETVRYGIIPLELENWNTGTNVITLKFKPEWKTAVPGMDSDLDASSALEDDIQALTVLLVASLATPFFGQGIKARGFHIENPGTVTCLINSEASFNGDSIVTVEHGLFNYDPSLSAAAGADERAIKLQSVTPFLRAINAPIRLQDCHFNSVGDGHPLVFASVGSDFVFDDISGTIRAPNVWHSATNLVRGERGLFARGKWNGSGTAENERQDEERECQYYGYFPLKHVTPHLESDHLDVMDDGPPTGTPGEDYPAMLGERMHHVDGAAKFVYSNHDNYGYGKALTVDWAYRGGSWVLYVTNADDANLLFNGLRIGIDNGTDALEYFTIRQIIDVETVLMVIVNGFLPGSDATVWTGATIDQEAFAFLTLTAT